MTERQYVETLKAAAEAYLDLVIRKGRPVPESRAALRRWHLLRRQMSTHTFLRLADAWLAANPVTVDTTKEPA